MDIKKLREVINCTAEIKGKEISLTKLLGCLKTVNNFTLPPKEAASDPWWAITYQYCAILKQFADKLEENNIHSSKKQETINVQDHTNFLVTVDLVRQFSLNLYLPPELRGLTKSDAQLQVLVEHPERVHRLSYCVDQFRYLFHKKILALDRKMDDSAIDLIAGTYSLCVESVLSSIKATAIPEQMILKCLLMIKSLRTLSIDLCKAIHHDLLELIGEVGGFSTLCQTLLTVNENDESIYISRKSEIIAKIVSCKGHTKKFYRQVLTDCFKTYRQAIYTNTEDKLNYVQTCVECVRRLYQLPVAYRELHERIESYFLGRFVNLISPEETITGYVLVEQSTLLADLYECQMAFGGCSTSLPSSMLNSHLPFLLGLYLVLLPSSKEREYLRCLIIFCVSNRTIIELQDTVLSNTLFHPREYETIVKTGKCILHPRVIMKQSPIGNSYNLQIGSPSNEKIMQERFLLPALVDILKAANRNLLLYDVFIILLSELMTSTKSTISTDITLLDEVEQEHLMSTLLNKKIVLIQSLSDIIGHEHFHQQMYDNPDRILEVLESSLAHLIGGVGTREIALPDQQNEYILDVVLSIMRDFLKRIRSSEKVRKITTLLQRYRSSMQCSDQLKAKIEFICNNSTVNNDEVIDSIFQNALSLCGDPEPYCKVHGTSLLLKLIKDRDIETISHRHTILIMALVNLRSEESYAFLNSVRLLVSLSEVLESETVEMLLKEYCNGDNQLDYRLKVGEAIVKVVETLGPLAVRYKDELLNCFLRGTQSFSSELRTSSLSSIGDICRILCYQVHHFFYELFVNIDKILKTDQYVPARRASVLVLSQLIQGMESLTDCQEYLLSIYRILKHVIAIEKDDVTKMQAALALDHLKTKTENYFTIDTTSLEMRISDII